MDKIFENASEQHIRGINLYIDTSDFILYLDSKKTQSIDKDSLKHLFDINVINIIDNDKIYKAIDFKIDHIIYFNDKGKAVEGYPNGVSIDKPELNISTESDTPILGKNVSDFQTDISVEDTKITGTLKYIEGFTEFNGEDPSEQEGNYLFLNFKDTVADKIESKLIGGKHEDFIDCTSDKWMLYLISESCTAIELKLTKGNKTIDKTYNISELTLTPKG